jgi:hypothetical protein
MNKEMLSQAWLAFASAAVAGYEAPEDSEFTAEELTDDICEVATLIADNMLSEFEARWVAKNKPVRKPSARARRKPADDDGEEE